jgi:transcriptional regulator with XRE-family HTH domain
MTTERKGGDFGSKLREARERKGVSLRQIANDTKISMSVLEALERSDIKHLPGGIFTRSFVRSYAAEVGLDVEQAVEEFVTQFPTEAVTVGQPSATGSDEMQSFESDRRVASAVLWLIGLSIPLAGVVLYFAFGGRLWTASQPPVAPAAVAAAKAQPLAPVAPLDLLRLEIVWTRTSSLSIAIDEQPPVDLVLEAGARRTFEVKRNALLKIGDPRAVELTINGRVARPLGPSGAPATLHLTAENYEEFLGPR